MAEIRTVTTLKRKRDEIAASIKLYEPQPAQACSDPAHVEATIRIFAASGRPSDIARYVDCYRLFKRGEPWADLFGCPCQLEGAPGAGQFHAMVLTVWWVTTSRFVRDNRVRR